jgi:hypothetical protein
MGNIKIPRIERKTRDVTPEITTRAPESLAAPFAQDVPRLAAAIGDVGRGVESFAAGMAESIERHKNDKRKELVNDTYFTTFDEMELKFQEFKARKETAGENLIVEFDAEYEKLLGEAEVKLGGDPEATAALRNMIATDRKRWGRELAIKMVTDREIAKTTKDSAMLDKNVRTLIQTPTPTTLASAREQMRIEIEETGYDKNKQRQLIKLADQSLVEAYLGSIGPEQALAELDNRKLGYGALFNTTKEKENFRSILERKAKAQKTAAEKEKQARADSLVAAAMLDFEKDNPPDENLLYDDPAIKGNPKAIKTIQKMFNNYGKEIKQETRDREYRDAMNDPDLVTRTDAYIISNVQSIEDALKVIKWRDSVSKDSAANVTVERVRIRLEDDFKAGKFGKNKEGSDEYTLQLRDYQAWIEANPGVDAFTNYYKPLMDPKNAEYFDRTFFRGELTPEGLRQSRKREAWVNANREANPDYSDAELRDYYNENVRTRE